MSASNYSDSDHDQSEARSSAGASMTSAVAPDSDASGTSADSYAHSLDEELRQLENYPVHFNRRYHKYKEGSYAFPNDDQEQERMDAQFWIIKAAQGYRLLCAPVASPHRILDIGTGTGVWAIALADSDRFPDAHITGIDLSPIQPGDVPPNVYFEVQDCAEPDWGMPLESFGFIYCQSLFGSLQDYKQLLMTARKYLEPGTGWIECCEMDPFPVSDDGTMPDDWHLMLWAQWMNAALAKNGRQYRFADQIERYMIDAGYVDVHVEKVKIPIGSWPADPRLKKLGKLWKRLILETLSATKKPLQQAYEMNEESIECFLAATRESMTQRGIHSYHWNYTVYGRKPSTKEEKEMGRMQPPPLPQKQAAKLMVSVNKAGAGSSRSTRSANNEDDPR